MELHSKIADKAMGWKGPKSFKRVKTAENVVLTKSCIAKEKCVCMITSSFHKRYLKKTYRHWFDGYTLFAPKSIETLH